MANTRIARSRSATRLVTAVATVSLSLVSPLVLQSQVKNKSPTGKGAPEQSRSPASQTYEKEGVAVEFSLEALASGRTEGPELTAGTEATVRFKITDSNTGQLLTNLRPTAWIDQRTTGRGTDAKECREKVQSFLQPGFNRSASIDLNKYFILALNSEPNISVIDPTSGFGGSKLYTLVGLRSPGEDWVMSADKKRLYVSMPQANQVAVIDTVTWNVVASIDAGVRPARVALQHDNRYLWVGDNSPQEKDSSSITVIDTVTMKVAAQLRTGRGEHEIAFADDDTLVFVTNKEDDTLSVIDGRKLERITDLKVGSRPAAVTFSALSKAVYVANEGDGTIAVIDGRRPAILARMMAAPGLRNIRILADSRFGFVVNPVTSIVYVFDVTSNRMVHSVPVGPAADQITFTRDFAYARSTGNEFVTMIKIANLDKEASVSRFPAGEKAPRQSPARSLADAVVPAPEEGAVLVANPADKMIYYYTEGMAAPMGSFQNYRRDPKAVLVLDNGLRESARGIYTTTVRLGPAGNYDVALLLDAPRLVNCFDVKIAENPSLAKPTPVPIRIQPQMEKASGRVGETLKVRVRVTDVVSGEAKGDLQDLGVLVFLAPGIWQHRQPAKSTGNGIYEMSFVPPQAGVYYVYFQCPSLSVQYNKITPFTLQVVAQ